MMIASFLFFLGIFILIGVLSFLQNRHNNEDYLLASSSVKPWLVALSAVATNNSGYMFVGLIGFTYAVGLQSIWIMIGWIVGDLLISFLVHKPLREQTEKVKGLSFGEVLASLSDKPYKYVQILIGIVTVIFLCTYAAAQLNAGAKALYTLMGWEYTVGAIIGALIIFAYCFAGGIRASIWTDAAQSFVMFGAMLLMLFYVVDASGGFSELLGRLKDVEVGYMHPIPDDLAFGFIPFVLGWVAAGIGVIGQPHIMVRFMAMDNPENLGRVRSYYYVWYSLFSALCIGVGLCARLLIPMEANFDAELALPLLAEGLLHPIIVGLVLAGLFAATISTADSQVLSCTAALSRDMTNGKDLPFWVTKAATLFVTVSALLIAIYGGKSVFDLVLIAWSGMGAAIGPLLIAFTFGFKPSQAGSILMMITGLGTVILWRVFELNADVYSILPGLITPFIILFLDYGVRKMHSKS